MFLDFAAAIAALGQGAAFRIANEARPAGNYLFTTLLPEQNRPSYSVSGGNMTVRAMMAGLVSMDSPYPPAGFVESSEFHEQTAKLGNEIPLSEQALRHLQDFMMRMQIGGGNTNEALVDELLNFLDKAVIQPHLDTAEWMRGQALVRGTIDWTFNQKRLLVDYGIPSGNFLPNRTGTNHYGGSTSMFWADVTALRRLLRGNLRAIIAHPETIDLIRYNPANNLVTIGDTGGSVTFRRVIDVRGNPVNPLNVDAGDTITLISYGLEGEMMNPAAPDTPVVIPFMPRGRLLAVGNNTNRGYVVGQGSTDDAALQNALGYTHIAPTVEGGGTPGRWAELFTPQTMPWALHGRGVSNLLPVIEAPDLVAVASTDMA